VIILLNYEERDPKVVRRWIADTDMVSSYTLCGVPRWSM